MDLIYTDDTRVDQGVLHNYSMDIAYGADENDFELEVDMGNKAVLKQDCFIYFDGTEYGGIVDKIEVNIEDNKIVYSGRSWHGILDGRILEPDENCISLILNGEVHEVLRGIVDKLNLTSIFRVSNENTGIEIVSYEIEYESGYYAIRKMLSEYSLKLKMIMEYGYVKLYVENVNDYSQDEEFDYSQLDYTVAKRYNMTNHIIARGIDSGDGYSKEYVIHLFTDENGGVQPYAITNNPMKDSDYIMGKSKQIVSGVAEITQVINQDSINIVENYELLTAQPGNWKKEYTDFYTYDSEEDKYNQVEKHIEDVYSVLSSKPADWDNNFAAYFTLSNGSYSSVQGVEATSYKKLDMRPSNWKSNYGDYYYKYSDGVITEYKTAEGISHDKYIKQTRKPTDWNSNYSSYYRKATAKELKKNSEKQYYSVTADEKKDKKAHVPEWAAKKYYTKTTYMTASNFNKKAYYQKVVTTNAPTWQSGIYYSLREDVEIIPDFKSGTYFRQVLDHYANLVSSAIEQFTKESEECNEIEIDLDSTIQEYDIGDIVGASEPVTGIVVFQPITKKIIKLEEDSIPTITYEVGSST